MQQDTLFRRSIIEIIRYGRLDATDEECIAAAKTSRRDFIKTWITATIQRQTSARRTFSRAEAAYILCKNTAFRHEDTYTRRGTPVWTHTRAFGSGGHSRSVKGRTSFIVAHRLSTIRNCDRYFISRGVIAESGSHLELMERKGLYWELYTLSQSRNI
jgi:ATP-binding cassette subfamily B protein